MADMTALESICVFVGNKGKVSLQKIIHDKHPRPFGLYFGLSEIADGSLDKELMGYGYSQSAVSDAIKEVLQSGLYQEVVIERK